MWYGSSVFGPRIGIWSLQIGLPKLGVSFADRSGSSDLGAFLSLCRGIAVHATIQVAIRVKRRSGLGGETGHLEPDCTLPPAACRRGISITPFFVQNVSP
jgi:hypothetical protein